ncbi:hypothetical protein M2105_004521 [Paenibacillus sp. PastF-1]|nr:hypothetical protein [Paenibacillus sp. PastF-2]MDF9849939.1 hypothetical protein [Paenibacillus sp. PastM-2]MDF9856647.1 hypothetical protein [Paenibacillus sp. PastF-1]MDH6481916.1 hypothetical protein [Paenibacillus sp. PastH-2]MDH6509342.1 hypothetical protein [Paenibacillus sp. PastM-3]
MIIAPDAWLSAYRRREVFCYFQALLKIVIMRDRENAFAGGVSFTFNKEEAYECFEYHDVLPLGQRGQT